MRKTNRFGRPLGGVSADRGANYVLSVVDSGGSAVFTTAFPHGLVGGASQAAIQGSPNYTDSLGDVASAAAYTFTVAGGYNGPLARAGCTFRSV